jgi:threonylcarbamoyladenosine tRNA methylthiotransferase MtaB
VSEYEGKLVRFAEVLELVLANTQKIGIRISSLYPEIVNEKLTVVLANPRVRPYFHISVQSGSDAVLAKMKRPYKIEAVYRATQLLRKAKKNPFLACDIIAGFPGESDEDFDLTLKMLKECGFTFVHAFPFSPRPGTEAFKMRPMVPNYITDKRISVLEEFNKKSKTEYINSFVGQALPAVCETVHRAKIFKDRVIIHAVTENFLHCQLNFSTKDANLPVAGTEVRVKILRPLNDSEKTGESDTLAEIFN